MSLPGWNSLDSVSHLHAFFELAGLLLFAVLVAFEFLAHFPSRRQPLFHWLGLASFALAVLSEIIAYPYSHRKDDLYEAQQRERDAVASKRLEAVRAEAQAAVRGAIHATEADAGKASLEQQRRIDELRKTIPGTRLIKLYGDNVGQKPTLQGSEFQSFIETGSLGLATVSVMQLPPGLTLQFISAKPGLYQGRKGLHVQLGVTKEKPDDLGSRPFLSVFSIDISISQIGMPEGCPCRAVPAYF